MDRRASELLEKGRTHDVRPAGVDQSRIVQALDPAAVVDGPLSEDERYDAHATTQPRWRGECDLAWFEIPREKSIQNPAESHVRDARSAGKGGTPHLPLLFKIGSVVLSVRARQDISPIGLAVVLGLFEFASVLVPWALFVRGDLGRELVLCIEVDG